MPIVQPLILVIPSETSLLPVVRAFIEAVCRHGKLRQKTTDDMVLAVHEATSNAIRHAHQGQSDALIHIHCKLLENGIEVCISDQGEPFDLDEVPHFDPQEIRVGGRGVFLMRTLLDELTCYPQSDGGNLLRMVKWEQRSA